MADKAHEVEITEQAKREVQKLGDMEVSETHIESVDLDLEKYGKMTITQGGSKPQFDKITPMVVVAARLKTTPERKTKKDNTGKDQTYYPIFLQVEYEYKIGKEEMKKTYENYGEGRLYTSTTNENQDDKFWVGEQSALGKLKKLVQENFEFDNTLVQLQNLVVGKKVGVITESGKVGDKEYSKNIIRVFYPTE